MSSPSQGQLAPCPPPQDPTSCPIPNGMVMPAEPRIIPMPHIPHPPPPPGFVAPGLYPSRAPMGPFGPPPPFHYRLHPSVPPMPQNQVFNARFEPQFQHILPPSVLTPDGVFSASPPFMIHHPYPVPPFLPPPHMPSASLPSPVPMYFHPSAMPTAGPLLMAPPRPSLSPKTHLSSPVSSLALSSGASDGLPSEDHPAGRRKEKPAKTRTRISPRVPAGPSTELLYAFRNTQDRVWSLQELKGHISEFSRDQYGSRFVQDAIKTAGCADLDLVFEELAEYGIVKTSKDVCGNYVIQKILEHGTDSHKDETFQRLRGHMRELSVHIYGCRVVQKLLDVATPDQQDEIVRELEPHIPECVQSAHANHVVQKILEVVPSRYLRFVDLFRGRTVEFAQHTFGCRVIQRCLQHLPSAQAEPLLHEFMGRAFEMITDQFGNYVIQYILEHGPATERDYIISLMRGRMVHFSLHKHASNVCERALQFSSPRVQQELIDEMLLLDHDHFPRGIFTLVHNEYGNYVLQRAIQTARGRQKDYLISVVAQQLRHARVPVSGNHPDPQSVKYLAIDRTLKKYRNETLTCSPAPGPQVLGLHQPRLVAC